MKGIGAAQLVLIISFMLIFVQFTGAGMSSANIGANVLVQPVCPFAVNVAVQPTYSKALGTVTANYFVFTLQSCTLQPMSGFVNITKQSGSLVNSLPVNSGTLTNTPSAFTFNINLASLTNGVYYADVGFTSALETNHTSQQFEVLSPQNVLITGFSASSQVDVGAQQTFSYTLKNDGQLATGSITTNLVVTGPSNTVFSSVVSSLSPGQSANELVTLSDAANTLGSYTATITANYFVNGVNTYSNTGTLHYTVVSPSVSVGGGGGGGPPTNVPISAPPGISLSTSPLLVSLLQETSVLSQLGIRNNATVKETVGLSVSNALAPYVSLSASNLSVGPGQSVNVGMVFSTGANSANPSLSTSGNQLPAGAYIVPVNLTVSTGSNTKSQTEYITLNVGPKVQDSPVVLNEVSVVNGTELANGQVKVTNRYAFNFTNVTLETVLPLQVASNASQITTYGISATVGQNEQGYVIKWKIPSLPSNQTIYGYYSIEKPQSQLLLQRVQTQFSSVSQVPVENILRVVDVEFPTFYVSSTDIVAADLLYTGSSAQNVTVMLYGPSDARIDNPVQTFYAVPNQPISAAFRVTAGGRTGTSLFKLVMITNGANQTLSLPVLVLQKPVNATTATTTTAPSPFPLIASLPAQWVNVARAVVIIMIVSFIIFVLKVVLRMIDSANAPRYSEERAMHLSRMRRMMEKSRRAHGDKDEVEENE